MVKTDALDLYNAVEDLMNDKPIEEIDLSNRAIGDDGLDKLCGAAATHPTLERLVLDNSDITDSGVRNLAAMLTRNSSITSLSIQNNKIGTAGLEALLLMLGGEEGTLEPRNTTLREIKLDGNTAFPPASKFTDQWQEVCGVMTKVEEDIGSIEQREANRKLREKMELLMENHALGVMGDEKQLAADVE